MAWGGGGEGGIAAPEQCEGEARIAGSPSDSIKEGGGELRAK